MKAHEHEFHRLTRFSAVAFALGAVACFHAAYTPAHSGLLAFAIFGYVICLVQLARLRTTRQSFYVGLAVGFACFAPQLECFWRIFGPAAIALWLVLAFWIALFLALAHLALARFGIKRGALLVPFLWTGLEYFRSELYYLKFSWLNVGYAFAESPITPWIYLGVYGIGFATAAWSSLFLVIPARRVLIYTLAVCAALIVVPFFLSKTAKSKGPAPNLRVAGVQLEFPDANQIIPALDRIVTEDKRLIANHIESRPLTNLSLIVLSEYTLDGEPTDALRNWCRTNQKFLIVGGKDPAPGNNYYNTAFVISTNGEVVFKQVKSVPIQFFKDGLPAPEQKLWDSPWGKIGICICYDLCYTHVTDGLVRQGAQMIIAPTMDVAEWGRHQHELHTRVAPVRAAEYGIPIFRLASSGISQGVNRFGRVQSSAPFPGEGEMIFFGAHIGAKGSLPLDRYLAPLCVGVTGLFVVWLAVTAIRRTPAVKPQPAQA
jgi:apolipoprotein N-acyltransferase